MKFAAGIFTLALTGGLVVNAMSIRGNTKYANKLMASSRRLEEQSGDSNDSGDGESQDPEDSGDSGDEDDEYGDMSDDEKATYFLKNYSIKLLSCIQGEQVINYENNDEMESSTVIFRLCPSSSCDSSASLMGCDDGYGDYAVGINTFLDAYMESQNDNDDYNSKYAMINYNSYGEEFDASEYMECKEFERGEQEENNQQQQNNNYQGQYNGYYQDSQVFIGPGCTEDGLSIALHTYVDEDCSYPFQGNFSMVSSHWETLPFSDGGLVSMDCVSCAGQDNDGNLEVSEMCKQDYESSVYRCEQLMETNSSYFYATTSGCDYVENLVTEVYNNLTAGDAFAQVKAAVSETAKVVGTKFMDTMSTREAQAFIAGMVVFGISVFIGVTFVGCLLVKKRRKRLRLKKQTKLLPSGGADDGLPVSPSSVAKRRSSVVAFVRSSTNNIKQSVQAAVGSVTAATSTLSKKENGEDDGTVKSDYNNMTDAVTQTTGSYTAPQPALSSDTAPEEEILTNTSKPVITGTSSDEVPFVDETTALEEADLASELPPSTEELSEVPPSEDAIQIDESVTNSTAPDKMTGGRFLSKMDKHLKKKMSVKSMIKRK